MNDASAPQSDPRVLAIAHGRRVLGARANADSSLYRNDLVLRRKDRAATTAFLISLQSEPVRLLVPLRAGENIVARETDISDYDLILPDTLKTIPIHAWPRRWCEAGQCHIICRPPATARVADRSSAGTRLFRSGSPRANLPVPTGWYYYPDDSWRDVEPVTGRWDGDIQGWSLLFEGDVLVCLRGLWVFAWAAPPP
jgi:hypothetical protein